MNKFKAFIAKNFKGFAFYYHYLGMKMVYTVSISLLVGVLDGFGLAMFLPLLSVVNPSKNGSEVRLGKMQFIVDGFHKVGLELTLVSVLAVMVVFFSLKGVAVFLNSMYRVWIKQLFITKVRKGLVDSLNRVKFKFFVGADVGRIQNTLTGEVERVMASFSFYFNVARQGVLVIVYAAFAFFVDARFALFVAVGGIITNLLYQQLYRLTKRKSKDFTTDSHAYQSLIIQHVANFKYLRATALIKRFTNRVDNTIDEIELSRRKIGVYTAILTAAREPMLIIVIAIVIILQVNFFGSELGPILLSLLFFYRALTAVIAAQNFWNGFLTVSGSLDNVVDFRGKLNKNADSVGKGKFTEFKEAIRLKDGNFSYGDKPILKAINLLINKNESVAFVGESGSGKTTLTNIIAGLMPLDSGTLKIDDINIKDIDVAGFQRRIGYITQEPVIFNDTIFNNVTFWDKENEKNLERFQEALKRAAIFTFVENLKDGYRTELGNNGINLSGGQKQRISIARELYKDIDILILDEATSALDSETEKAIQESIDALQGQYTILMVAHRLSTVKNANKIVFMDKGQIVDIDTFQSLLKKQDRFKKMVALQELL